MTETLPRRGFLGRMVAALTGGTWLASSRANAAGAQIDDQQYVGEIRLFAGSVPPFGWMLCQGQLLDPFNDNYNALFNLIGTTYGGDGSTTFGLPDLRGRTPLHQGNSFVMGQVAGSEQVTLSAQQIPAHNHTLGASSVAGTSDSPAGQVPARNAAGAPRYGSTATTDLSPTALLLAGGSQSHPNMQPYLGINFMISIQGIFPSQT
jgi:microcystin-dependent protein